MPIKGDSDYLKQLADNNVCAEHNDTLTVAWSAKENSHILYCGQGHNPDTIRKVATRTEEFKRGLLAPVGKGLNLLPTADLETGEVLSPSQVQGLIDYATKYHLDPFRGHVVMMHGRPYIGLDGYIYHAREEKVPYKLASRPLTPDERPAYQVDEGDHAWFAELTIIPTGAYFNGVGIVTKAEMEAPSKKNPEHLRSPVVAAHPWQMAQKRAEWQAMRRGFPIGESDSLPRTPLLRKEEIRIEQNRIE